MTNEDRRLKKLRFRIVVGLVILGFAISYSID